MDRQNSRYKQMEQIMTLILLISFLLFIVFLVAAGKGILWLKVLTAIITILVCALCLAFLYTAKLLFRPRSLWMTVASGCILLCLLFSLFLNYPSPL